MKLKIYQVFELKPQFKDPNELPFIDKKKDYYEVICEDASAD